MRWKTPVFPRGSTWAENQSRRSQMHILGRHVNFSTRGLDSARHGVLGRFPLESSACQTKPKAARELGAPARRGSWRCCPRSPSRSRRSSTPKAEQCCHHPCCLHVRARRDSVGAYRCAICRRGSRSATAAHLPPKRVRAYL
jgi:hypothetical protein